MSGYKSILSKMSSDDLDSENDTTSRKNFLKSLVVKVLGGEEGELQNFVPMMFEFFTRPKSSKAAYCWAALTCALVIFRILEIGLESCNGPNQYRGRKNMAQYNFLLSADHYWDAYVAFMVPLIIDAAGRLVLLGFIYFGDEHEDLLEKISEDGLEIFLFICDIMGVIPFFVALFYYHPSKKEMSQGALVLLTLIELLITGRILRLIKDIPAIRAIRITLRNSAPHLVLPLFFFFVFNITAAVLFYFIEPCYNYSDSNFPTCAGQTWTDLFDATFYSVVTMTTTGYGNQTPVYEVDRFIACCVMVFGSLFLSMPLAIIGNEYDKAWNEVNTAGEIEKETQLKESIEFVEKAKASQEKKKGTVAKEPNAPADYVALAISSTVLEERRRQAAQNEKEINSMPVMSSLVHMRTLVKQALAEGVRSARMTPRVLLLFCEVRAWIPTLYFLIKQAYDNGEQTDNELPYYFPGATLESQTFNSAAPDGGQTRRMSLFNRNTFTAAAVASTLEKAAGRSHTAADIRPSSIVATEEQSQDSSSSRAVEPSGSGGSSISRKVRQSLIQLPSHVHAAATKLISNGTVSDDFKKRFEEAQKDPTHIRNRLWILLEVPQSSKEARILQLLLVFLVVLSIFVLYTQTVLELSSYGESTEICGMLLQQYCGNKHDESLDPGCFVQSGNGGVAYPSQKLTFDSRSCTAPTCFGHGYNFGSPNTYSSCLNETVAPFQTTTELWYNYGIPTVLTTRQQMHQRMAVCSRIECDSSIGSNTNSNRYWIIFEFIINTIFTIEILLRISVTNSFVIFFRDLMNITDLLAVFPFYAEIFNAVLGDGFLTLNFSILASSPGPIFLVTMRSLKVFRMFKLTRHFHASKVLSETARRVWKQILGMIALLSFLTVLFAILLYQVERGKRCYVGDPGCPVPSSIAGIVHEGDMILIDKKGNLSRFGNVFYGLWYCFVTLTTTGYGDVVPATSAGQAMGIFLMISGVFYMAMPLTAAATNYYTVHLEFKDKETKLGSSAVAPINASGSSEPPRSRESVRLSAVSMLEILQDMNTFADGLQKPSCYPMGIESEGGPPEVLEEEEENENEDDDSASGSSDESVGEQKRGGNNPATADGRAKRKLLLDPRMPKNASAVLKHVHSLFMALDEVLATCKIDLRVMLELQLELKSKKK